MPDFQIGGRLVHLETTNVIDRLRGIAPEAIGFHAVMIEGRPYPVVQALEVASGVPRGLTRSVRARHVLGSLGFVLVELRGSSPPARSGPTSPRPTVAEPIASAVDLSTVLHRLSSDRAPLPEVIAGRSSLQLDGFGIYAIYGNERTWAALGVAPFDDRPLYVGKVESGTLLTRDIRTHFATGRTGSSTVRRSFAAMLHDDLGLTGIPRNPDRPADFANYGLSPADDETLTAWMLDHLDLGGPAGRRDTGDRTSGAARLPSGPQHRRLPGAVAGPRSHQAVGPRRRSPSVRAPDLTWVLADHGRRDDDRSRTSHLHPEMVPTGHVAIGRVAEM